MKYLLLSTFLIISFTIVHAQDAGDTGDTGGGNTTDTSGSGGTPSDNGSGNTVTVMPPAPPGAKVIDPTSLNRHQLNRRIRQVRRFKNHELERVHHSEGHLKNLEEKFNKRSARIDRTNVREDNVNNRMENIKSKLDDIPQDPLTAEKRAEMKSKLHELGHFEKKLVKKENRLQAKEDAGAVSAENVQGRLSRRQARLAGDKDALNVLRGVKAQNKSDHTQSRIDNVDKAIGKLEKRRDNLKQAGSDTHIDFNKGVQKLNKEIHDLRAREHSLQMEQNRLQGRIQKRLGTDGSNDGAEVAINRRTKHVPGHASVLRPQQVDVCTVNPSDPSCTSSPGGGSPTDPGGGGGDGGSGGATPPGGTADGRTGTGTGSGTDGGTVASGPPPASR